MRPTFKNVALKLEKKEKDIFSVEKQRKSEAILISAGKECEYDDIQSNIGKTVLFNGRIIETVEETEEYFIVLAHQESVIAIL